MEESLIGREYIPVDNSYEVNLTDQSAKPTSPNRITKITSEPFLLPIISQFSEKSNDHWMVAVSYENQTFITMYNERGLLS